MKSSSYFCYIIKVKIYFICLKYIIFFIKNYIILYNLRMPNKLDNVTTIQTYMIVLTIITLIN